MKLNIDPSKRHPNAKALRKQYKSNRKPVARSKKTILVNYMGKAIRLPLRVDGSVIMPDGSVSHYKQLTVSMKPKAL